MVIGEAAKASGISAKMLRHYEAIGLIPAAGRTDAGYRLYGARDVETLRFIRRARDLGLSISRIRQLVGLWQDRQRPSREVKRIALEHVAELRAKVSELTAMCDTLNELASACRGDQRPDCPILRDLEAGTGIQRAAPTAAFEDGGSTRRIPAASGLAGRGGSIRDPQLDSPEPAQRHDRGRHASAR